MGAVAFWGLFLAFSALCFHQTTSFYEQDVKALGFFVDEKVAQSGNERKEGRILNIPFCSELSEFVVFCAVRNRALPHWATD